MLFHYKRTRRQQALTILINILMLPLLLYAFEYVAKEESNFEEMYTIAKYIAFGIAAILTIVLLCFLKSKNKFELYVTNNEFYCHHPTFNEWCFNINPNNINAIEHNASRSSDTTMTSIDIILKDGTSQQLCKNYAYSRKNLYAALHKANPDIAFPDNIYLFKQEKSKEMDEYVSKRFPLLTKIIKTVLRRTP